MFSCASCPMTYNRRWLLQRHVDTKHSCAKHKCELCPAHKPKWFPRKDTLQRHLQTKHPSPLQASMKNSNTTCSKCRKSFLRADYTRKHEERCHKLADPPPEPQAEWSPPQTTSSQDPAEEGALSSEPTFIELGERPPSQNTPLLVPKRGMSHTMQAFFNKVKEADITGVESILTFVQRSWNCDVDTFAYVFDAWVQCCAFGDELARNAMADGDLALTAMKYSLFLKINTPGTFIMSLWNTLIALRAGHTNRLLAHIFNFTCGVFSDLPLLFLSCQRFDVNMQNLKRETALIRAIRNNDNALVHALLNVPSVDVNIRDGHGRTAMMHAIIQRSSYLVHALLINGKTNLDIQDSSGTTALMLAVSWWLTDGAPGVELLGRFLWLSKSNINFQDSGGRTALILTATHSAMAHGEMRLNMDFVQALLQVDGIDVNARDKHGQTALIHASLGLSLEIVEALLRQVDIDVNARDRRRRSALTHAFQIREKATPKTMARGASLVEMLLNTAFGVANTHTADSLARRMGTIQNGDPVLMGMLPVSSQTGVNQRNEEGMTALMLAMNKYAWLPTNVLVAVPEIDVKLTNYKGKKALAHAVKYQADMELVGWLLLIPQLDLNIKDYTGATAFIQATRENRHDVFTALVTNKKVEVNAVDLDGWTALTFAACGGYVEMIKLLLTDGRVQINMQNHLGRTALMYAAEYGHRDVVEILLAARDIDVHVKDIRGRTAQMCVSHSKKHAPAISNMLHAAGDSKPSFLYSFAHRS